MIVFLFFKVGLGVGGQGQVVGRRGRVVVGQERTMGGQMFGRRRRVLSVVLLIYILWLPH